MARQVKSKVKSTLIISFDFNGIVYKQLVLAGQTVNPAYYHDILRRRLRPELRGQNNWLLSHDNARIAPT
jgi:hypothetical protein